MIFRARSRPILALLLVAAVAGQSLAVAATSSPTLAAISSHIGAPTGPASALASPSWQPALPIRAAFFYPWFPEAWTQLGTYPYTRYNPSLGFYDSSSTSVIAHQIAAMQYGHIQAGIASWWGQGSKTDTRIPALLAGAAGTTFRWSLYYEREGTGDPTVAQIQSDLAYIRTKYAADPAYLRIGGKPVLFVYGDGTDGCAMATRWAQADPTHAFYVVLKVFAGYRTCVDQPANWHQYAPAGAEDSQAGHAFTISPGFYKASEPTPRLARSPAAWTRDIADMVASNAPLQLVTTFNEWGEGTAVESAAEWASTSGYGTYLDALHANPGYGSGTVSRLAGANRFATAAAISAATFAPGVDVAYIAYAFNYPDALAGAAAAGTVRGPVLLAATNLPLDSATSTELTRLKPKRIVVLGSAGVISDAVKVALAAYTSGTVSRLAGANRFATAAAISAATFTPGVDVAYIAYAFNYPDALAGAAAAGTVRGPVLLAATNLPLDSATSTELTRLKPKRIVVLGSAGVISDAVKVALAAYTSGTVSRLAGANRFATAAAISAATFGPGVDVAYIAYAFNYPDALAGAAAAGTVRGPVLLAATNLPLDSATSTELTRLKPKRIVVLGSSGVISDAVKVALAAWLGP